MWPYTPDEQTWLAPAKEWTAAILAERAKRAATESPEVQLPLPLPMPAPFDDFVTDPQVMVAR